MLDGPASTRSDAFADGGALFVAVCELGDEGVVGKNNASRYGPSVRGWVTVKNLNYWPRDAEFGVMRRSSEPKRRAVASRRRILMNP